MTDDMNKNEGAPTPETAVPAVPTPVAATPTPAAEATPVAQPVTYQAPAQTPPAQQQPPVAHMPAQQQPPTYAPVPQPVYAPAPLMQLTGGMKFGWLVVGFLGGIVGILIAWLTNVDKVQTVKNDAVKWSLFGLLIGIVLGFLMAMLIGGMMAAMMAGAFSNIDPSYMGHGYSSF